MREPDFEQFLKVLHRECPDRPTLFEFAFDSQIYLKFNPHSLEDPSQAALVWRELGYESAKERHGALSTCILQPMQMSVIRLKRRIPVAANGK